MKQQEIILYNERIVEFMGWAINGNDVSIPPELYHPKFLYDFEEDINELKFHTSWDRLMYVVERIECNNEVYEFNISWDNVDKLHHCEISPSHKNTFNTIYTTAETKMEAVYKAVLMFIEWYNEQSK